MNEKGAEMPPPDMGYHPDAEQWMEDFEFDLEQDVRVLAELTPEECDWRVRVFTYARRLLRLKHDQEITALARQLVSEERHRFFEKETPSDNPD